MSVFHLSKSPVCRELLSSVPPIFLLVTFTYFCSKIKECSQNFVHYIGACKQFLVLGVPPNFFWRQVCRQLKKVENHCPKCLCVMSHRQEKVRKKLQRPITSFHNVGSGFRLEKALQIESHDALHLNTPLKLIHLSKQSLSINGTGNREVHRRYFAPGFFYKSTFTHTPT